MVEMENLLDAHHSLTEVITSFYPEDDADMTLSLNISSESDQVGTVINVFHYTLFYIM